MADKEARIRIGIDNAAQTISDLDKISGKFRGLGKELQGLRKLAVDAGKAVIDIKPPNLKENTDDLERYRDSATRLAVAMNLTGKAAETLGLRMAATGARVGMTKEAFSEGALELGKLTNDLKGATEGYADLAIEANNTARAARDLIPLAGALHNRLSVPNSRLGVEMRRMGDIATRAGTQGGRVAFQNTIQGLAPTLGQFDTSTPEARERLYAFVAAAGGNLPQEQAQESAAQALGWISGDVLGLGKYLGRKTLIDDKGKIMDPTRILEMIKRRMGRTRDKAAALRVLANYTSPLAAPLLRMLSEGQVSSIAEDTTAKGTVQRLGVGLDSVDLSNPEAVRRAQEEAQLLGREPDRLMETEAGQLTQDRLNYENAKTFREETQKALKSRDKWNKQFRGREGDRAGVEGAIDALPAVPYIGQGLQDAAIVGAGAATYLTADGPGEGTRQDPTARLLEQQLAEQKQTNQLLRQQKQDPNSSDVKRRKGNGSPN